MYKKSGKQQIKIKNTGTIEKLKVHKRIYKEDNREF